MAEGGDLSSTVRGSDACFEYTCTPCADEGDTQEALKYCQECKEYLCATCVKHHQKVSATKNHTLHDRDFSHEERSEIDTAATDDKMFKCLNHPERDIEMYCGAHEMVYCSLCIAKEHRQCNEILELDEAAEKFPTNTEDLLQQIDDLQPDIKATKQKKIDNLISLEQDKNDILKTIDDTEILIIGKVKELASDAKLKTCVRFDDLTDKFQHEISSLLQGITKIDELKTAVETQNTPDAKRNFVRYILQKRVIIQTKIMHDDTSKDEKKMKCFINNDLIQRISTAECLVHIVGSKSSIVSDTKPLHKKSQTEVNIKTTTDKETCCTYGISQVFDGTFILADYTNEKLKRMNREFRIIEEFILKSNPIDLCLTGKREVAVKLKNDTIMFVSIDDKLMEKYSIRIENGKRFGLACFYNNLWVCNRENIKVFDKSGTVLKTFSKETFEGTKFESPAYLIPVTASDVFVFVSDLKNKVACLDREGNVWSVMESERLKLVRRACIATNGIIFIAGHDSGNIMMFTENGTCLGELVTGLDRPDSLCYDSQNHQLIVGHWKKNTLTIISTGE